jgi:hypothetical protein
MGKNLAGALLLLSLMVVFQLFFPPPAELQRKGYTTPQHEKLEIRFPLISSPQESISLQPRCLSFTESLDDMIFKTNLLLMLTPAKVAGTSLHSFALECFGNSYPGDAFAKDNTYLRKFLTNSYELPKLLASHVSSDSDLINILKHSSDGTMIVLLYRNERDRLISAIKHIVKSRICGDWPDFGLSSLRLNTSDNACVVHEETLVTNVIEKRLMEISMGTAGRLLSCSFYHAFADSAARVLFLHYKQANHLQQVAAKHYCPNLQMAATNQNDDSKKEKAFVQLGNGTRVLIDDWLQVKKEFLQLTLRLDRDASCQRHTKMIENSLLACPENMIELAFES